MTRFTTEMADEDLATGDREAFAVLYERYSSRLYDYLARIARDEQLAADLMQTSFLRAWERLPERKPGAPFKAWLFAIAHNAAIDEFRRRKRSTPLRDGGDDEMSPPGLYSQLADEDPLGDPQSAASRRDLANLVWEAASALSPNDYSLLHLTVREGLEPDELAAQLGSSRGAIYTRLTRMRQALGEAVATALLVRHVRQECPELAALVAPGVVVDATLRNAISRHADGCSRCGARRRTLVAPVELFGAFSPIPISPALQDEVWAGVKRAMDRPGAGPAQGRNLLRVVVPAALFVAVVGLLIAALASRGGGPGPTDPSGFHSPSHQPGVISPNGVIVVKWTKHTRARAYSIAWDANPRTLPDEDPELDGSATHAQSPDLGTGEWYFHLRTRGEGSRWTSTVHLGPFLVSPDRAPAASQSSPAPATLTATATATDTPTAGATASAAVTVTPVAQTQPPVTVSPTPPPPQTQPPPPAPTPSPTTPVTPPPSLTPTPAKSPSPTPTPTPTLAIPTQPPH